MKIAVVGIGRVGLPLAVVLSKYHDTVGVDVDSAAVERVNSGKGFTEPQVEEYLSSYHLRATTDFSSVRDCQLVFVCVGSQAPGKGYSSDRFMSALESTVPHLVSKDQLLVITTTLPPMDLKARVVPYLSAHRLEDRTMGFCYNPAMIALGRAVADFEKPNYMMVGESNPEAGARLESFWKDAVGSDLRVFRASVMDIAVAKYALNTALVAKISLMSFVTELCEKEGSDVDVIAEVLKADPRIGGQKMFKGGLGYGGTCFPVDIEAARYECEELGVPTDYPDALTALNDWQVERSVRLLKSFGKDKVTVLGLSFKQDTEVVAASQSLEIARRLADAGLKVTVYDPRAMGQARGALGSRVSYAGSLNEALAFGDVVFIGVEWGEFSSLKGSSFRPDQIVVDPWRMLKGNPPAGRYVPYGMG